jgi:mannose-6-phosphate isomerase-like protein (cupin superfamily)
MNVEKVIAELAVKYPGKRIVQKGKDSVTEIICEIEPAATPDAPSRAVAVIDSSEPHYHKKTTEYYRVIQGELTIFIDEFPHRLAMGEGITVGSGQAHYATGNETWVEVVSEPGWTSADHYPAN